MPESWTPRARTKSDHSPRLPKNMPEDSILTAKVAARIATPSRVREARADEQQRLAELERCVGHLAGFDPAAALRYSNLHRVAHRHVPEQRGAAAVEEWVSGLSRRLEKAA